MGVGLHTFRGQEEVAVVACMLPPSSIAPSVP